MRWRNPIVWLAALAILSGVLVLGAVVVSSADDSTAARFAPAAVTASGAQDSAAASPSGAPAAAGPTTAGPTATAKTCTGGWSCDQQTRFKAASTMVAGTSGHVGIVVQDRTTGAVWTAGEPDYRIWAGSTPKLAFAVALREEARAGDITLDATAEQQIGLMLSVSDNNAAETLWTRYANASALMTRFRQQYGMTNATYVSGFPSRWGFIKCTAQDLAHLMSYILTKFNATDRTPLINAMRTVGAVQHWGVWGAGSALQPGVKDGWSIESDDGKDHWITATVGFVGPSERYIVAAMYHQPPGGDTIDKGVHLLTDLVATIFGAPVPAPVTIPQDY
jgi:hypothetical protein